MAKKKTRRMGRKGSFRGFARRARSSGSSENLMLVGGAAALYGASRPYIEQAIAPFTSKIPIVGQYADEAVLGAAGFFAAKGKFGSNKYLKAAGKAVFIIECARVGSGVASQMMNK
jgi:hypothetical protein